MGSVVLTVGVALGPVWGLWYYPYRNGPRISVGSVVLTVGVALGPV